MSTLSRFAICLFKEEVDSLDSSILLTGNSLEQVSFSGNIPNNVLLFQKKSTPSTPPWVSIVQTFGNVNPTELASSSSGAILFVEINKRILGCCSGSSVAYINKNNIESDFGLGVVFQRMQSNQTKSVSSFTLTNNPITNNRNSTIPTTRDSFDIDNYLENITELEGYFISKSKKTLIKGKEFYSSPSPKNIQDIIQTCSTTVADYLKSSIDSKYQSLTATSWVKDKKLISILDKEMLNAIQKNSKDVYISNYESFENLALYRFTPKGDGYLDIDTDVFYSVCKGKLITLDFLKSRKIIAFDINNEELANWSLYKCLFIEVLYLKKTYILYKGKWYKIESNYLANLRNSIKKHEIAPPSQMLPWNSIDTEGQFNIDASVQLNGQCWDKKLYTTNNYNYGIEFCDILTLDYIFHVKKYSGSQLTSHLLMQTCVSAQLLNSDPGLKKWINQNSKSFGKNLIKNNKNIEFFILFMCDRTGMISDILPFFSLITVHLAIKKITQLGFKVNIGKI